MASNAASMTPATSCHPLLHDSSSALDQEDTTKSSTANDDGNDDSNSDDDVEHRDNGSVARRKPLADSMTTEDLEGDDVSSEQEHPPAGKGYPQPLELSSSSSSGTTRPTAGTSTGISRSANTSKKRRAVDVPSSWQEFCHRGSRFRTLLDGAVEKVASATMVAATAAAYAAAHQEVGGRETADNPDNDNDGEEPGGDVGNKNNERGSLVEKLAREMKTENILLQKQLEQERSENVSLHAMIADLRDTKKQLVAQNSKLTGAYKHARQNANRARYVMITSLGRMASRRLRRPQFSHVVTCSERRFCSCLLDQYLLSLYREDADTAETTAATIAAKLEALETVVLETKRASQLLLQEQEQVTQAATIMESKYTQSLADLVRSIAAEHKLRREHSSLTKRVQQVNQQLQDFSNDLQQEGAEKQHWKRRCHELEATHKTQEERLNRLEKDLQTSQSLLVDATTATTETTQAKNEVEAAMERLQSANQGLHTQLQDFQQSLRQEKESHQKALSQVQQDHHATQVQSSNQREHIQSLKLEKQTDDKRIAQLESKLANMQRRLEESTNLTVIKATNVGQSGFLKTPANKTSTDLQNPPSSASPADVSFVIPPLMDKENMSTPSSISKSGVTKCSLCFKDSSGLMKKCECGRPECTFRAHQICVHRIHSTAAAGKTSVSHPGTPAPRLPVILCSSTVNSLIDYSRRHTISSSRMSSNSATKAVAAISPGGVATPSRHVDG